jgi:hypothetical protein
MMGAVLAQLAIGIAQGYGTYKQGKKIIKAGEEIKNTYGKLKKQEGKLIESAEFIKTTAKKIKGYQDKQAKMQYEHNKKEISRALEGNLRGLLAGYVSARENLEQEVMNVRSKLAFKDIKNVEDSSIKSDSINKLNSEAKDKANIITQNQMNEIEELDNQTNNYYYQNGLNYNRTQEGINQNYLTAYSQAELQLKRDLAQLNQTIENGNITGNQLIDQGWNAKVAGINQMTQAALDAAKSYAMGKAGGNLPSMPSGEIKEIPGTYNANDDVFKKSWSLKGFGKIGGING